MLSFPLQLKARIVGTSLEPWAHRARWLFGARQRIRHPELWELYLEEKRLPNILSMLLTKDSCCMDVGAHIGSFLSLLTRFAPAGGHIAFEPSPSKARMLRRRFPDVLVLEEAVSDTDGYANFCENYQSSGFSKLGDGENSYKVRTHRIDGIPIDRLDFIKLDIEGHELAALRGARETIRKLKPALMFECGTEYVADKIDKAALYLELNDRLGYDIYCFSDFLFNKGSLGFDEFRKCGIYPFRALNFLAFPR
jgi:FkbM family methyltransferase